MSPRCVAITAAVLAALVLISWKILGMRKEIPSQDIIPLNRGIAVVNGDPFLLGKIKATLYTENGFIDHIFDKKGFAIFENLSNQKKYRIKIVRTDLKGKLLYKSLEIEAAPIEKGVEYLILIGASIGKAWEFEKLPKRLHWKAGVVLGFRAKYEFDKSSEIESLLNVPIPVSAVIIKECAAYFPRSMDPSQKFIEQWVNLLRSKHIIAILATVVPVTIEHDYKNPGRLKSILAFNEFIREYASKEGIALLDLEKELRNNGQDRHLNPEYAAPDGLHLTEKAYKGVLDKVVIPVIREAAFNNVGS